MALAHPVKVVLKSTTTQTLSDRFTDMHRKKTVAKNRNTREDAATLARATAKNRRLAEQMSRRTGGKAMMDQINKETVHDRIDRSKIKSDVRKRLGARSGRPSGSVQNRLGRGASRGANGSNRGQINTNRGRGRGGNSSRGASSRRGSFRGESSPRGRGGKVGGNQTRGQGRGRGRGKGRGRGRSNAPDQASLDQDIDSYMTSSKS